MPVPQYLDIILEPLMAAVRRAERFLGPEDDWVEEDRRIVFEAAQSLFGRWHTFVSERSTAEYTYTAHATPDAVERALMGPYQRNLASNRKYRTHHDGGKQWAVGSLVYDPRQTDWQHHVYLFRAPNGACDIYAHRETSVREGSEHLTEPDIHGDPNDRIAELLHAAGIKFGTREIDG